MVGTTADRTREVIAKAWGELRPGCRNDHTAIKKITAHINNNRLTLRRLNEETVSNYTIALKLRVPFKRSTNKIKLAPAIAEWNRTHPLTMTKDQVIASRLTQPPTLLPPDANRPPVMNLFGTALRIVREIDRLPPHVRKLIADHLQMEVNDE